MDLVFFAAHILGGRMTSDPPPIAIISKDNIQYFNANCFGESGLLGHKLHVLVSRKLKGEKLTIGRKKSEW